MFKLEVLNRGSKSKHISVKPGLAIGSGPACAIRAQHRDLMPVHARVVEADKGRLFIELVDEGGHLHINGQDVLRSELRHQDLIVVGPLRFKVIDEKLTSHAVLRLEELLDQLDSTATDEEVYDFAKEDLFYLTTKDPMLRSRIAFRIPSRDRFIDQAQQFLARMVKQSGMDEMKVEAFVTCAKELILNAHRHGHKYDEAKQIILRYHDDGSAIALTIEDQGPGFDHRELLDKVRGLDAAAAARARYKAGGFGGLGFQMITRMADDLRYNEKGNAVTFTVKKQP